MKTAPNLRLLSGSSAGSGLKKSPTDFYDELADCYDRFMPDWRSAVRRQGKYFDDLIRDELGDTEHRILDCMSGIGTQALGLAARGHEVVAADISSAAVRRLEIEAAEAGLTIDLHVRDVRKVSEVIFESCDAVLACDNSISHLLNDSDLVGAFQSMRNCVKPEGLLVVGLRDYDRHLTMRPTATAPQVIDGEAGRRISFQTWDWDGDEYDASWFLLTHSDDGFDVKTFEGARCRAHRRNAVTSAAIDAGWQDVRWIMPDGNTGHHQPLLLAKPDPGYDAHH
jgi:glycine/sarcosine N-methyltransferase